MCDITMQTMTIWAWQPSMTQLCYNTGVHCDAGCDGLHILNHSMLTRTYNDAIQFL